MAKLPKKERKLSEDRILTKWKIRKARPLCDDVKRVSVEEALKLQRSRFTVSGPLPCYFFTKCSRRVIKN